MGPAPCLLFRYGDRTFDANDFYGAPCFSYERVDIIGDGFLVVTGNEYQETAVFTGDRAI